jgi:DNA-directed RNA polymerase specialized sigma24 family protein
MATDGNSPESAERTAAQFATTHWSVVLAAGDSASPDSREALEKLCRTYWYPLYAFVRRKGCLPEDAKDLTQAFFERFLEKHYLKDVLAEKGRFRTFLLTSLTHFLADEWDKVRTAKRGGGLPFLSLDLAVCEERFGAALSNADPPERHFDVLWAEAVMGRALDALAEEHQTAGKLALFEALSQFLSRSAYDGEYAAVGERLGLSGRAVTVAVSRLRDRYRALIRAEIAQTVENRSDVDAELRYLIELVAKGG